MDLMKNVLINKFKIMKNSNSTNQLRKIPVVLSLFLLLGSIPQQAFAHCDSYSGPVIQDAYKAFATHDVSPVLKWIEPKHEKEISALFQKTLKYQEADGEVYQLLEQHFLETLVRLHREGEGETFTGLKPAGTTSEIIKRTDAALNDQEIETLLANLNTDLAAIIRKKYERVAKLKQVKDHSLEEGRAYVAAYVDYTHTIETLYGVLHHVLGGTN